MQHDAIVFRENFSLIGDYRLYGTAVFSAQGSLDWALIHLMQSLRQAWRNVCEEAEALKSIQYNGEADISPTFKLARAD